MRWLLFFFVYALVYGGPHVFLIHKIRQFWPAGAWAAGIFFSAMIAAPIASFLLERSGMETAGRFTAWIGFVWMGFLLLFFTSLGLSKLAFSAIGRGTGPGIYILSLVVAAGLALWSYFAALTPRLEHVRIQTPNWPAGQPALRMVQLSDLHAGLIIREPRMRRLLARVRALRPDVIVSTGDLVDAQINHCQECLEALRSLQAGDGKYAVTGNHEYYAGLEQALAFTRAAGFRVLAGEAVQVRPGVWIAGVDDPAGGRTGHRVILEPPALPQAEGFKLLLKHRPQPIPAAGYDLQLSGHVHAGQIFPFGLLTRMAHRYHQGLYRLGEVQWLYVSRGTGTWGPPMRFLAPPEITLIEVSGR